MFESKNSTLGIYNRVDVNQLGYCNAFTGLIQGYEVPYNTFGVRYDSIKPFNARY